MRTACILLVTGIFFASCSNQPSTEAPPVVKGKTLTILPISTDKITGTYLGEFKGSPIAITLNYVTNSHASGYNVHKGLIRNVSGTIEATAKGLRLQLAEPGNNQYDGKFDLLIDTTSWSGQGTWTPFKKGDEAKFNFKKKVAVSEEEQYGVTFSDSLMNYITLKPDGSCTYTYLTDTTNTGQEVTIRGNYTKDKKAVTVFWEKNNVFSSKSVFQWIETKVGGGDDGYLEKSLKGEGRLFTQMWD